MINKYSKRFLFKDQRGIALFMVAMILVISTILSLGLFYNFQSMALTSEVEAYRKQALYVAEIGVNLRIREISRNATLTPSGSINFTHFPYLGTYTVSHTTLSGEHIITSIGKVPSTSSRFAERELRVVVNSTTFVITQWEDRTKLR